jgi:CheY-like chemotaxis protein/HAMP domain-containing protein/putative methionine-R-sulfoxide reductase with GAF domain
MTINRFIKLFCGAIILVLLLMGLLNWLAKGIQGDIVRSEQHRFQSYQLAQELFQSSEELTRMARTYATTGDERYERYYFDILAIRNGEKPRPEGYDVTHWHLAGVGKGAPAVMGAAVPLHELMRRVGVNDEEFALLREAQNNSDELVNLERQAFAAIKGQVDDGQGNFTTPAVPKPDRERALGLLYGERYINEKARIMAPLKRFKAALEQRTEAELQQQQERLQHIIVMAMTLTGLALLGVLATLLHARRVLLGPLEQLGLQAAGIAQGNYAARCAIPGDNELGELGEHFNNLATSLAQSREEEAVRDWFKSGQFELNGLLRGDRLIVAMAGDVLQFLAAYLDVGVGALYVYDAQQEQLELVASYAFTRRKALSQTIALGEGLAGEAAREKKTICWQQVPADFLPIESALGQTTPAAVVAVPLLHDDKLVGLVELGRFAGFSDRQLEFLARAAEIIAIAMGVSQSRQRVNDLLSTTQMQAEELRVQQEELQQSNEELEERAQTLEKQREVIRLKNQEVEAASRELQLKAEELMRTSTYKSEFLANMSHELRTPLNSMLILSNLLKQNKDGNLSSKQLEYAATIHGSGKDLLNLINDILDLSKIEAGQLQFSLEQVPLSELTESVQALFAPVAEDRGLGFELSLEDGLPRSLHTDLQRSQQVLKNLLGNAFKFTERGQVSLRIYRPAAGDNPLAVPALAFAVSDSGIGIAADQLEHIFQAFKQADGSTNRQYGGTGLGLSISRQLARGLGGEVTVRSQLGQGSTFTFYLPSDVPAATPAAVQPAPSAVTRPAPAPSLPTQPLAAIAVVVADDRDGLQSGTRSILIIEDDQNFAGILRDCVREQGFAALVAVDGESGISLASHYLPSAIILDVMLPHIDGWGVMRCLQGNPATRHIPVHFLTCLEERQKALSMGAIGFTNKPVSIEQLEQVLQNIGTAIDKGGKRLLIVEDDATEARSLALLLESQQIEISIARSGTQALQMLAQQGFDCMVLDLGLADMSGFELLERLSQMPEPPQLPVIVHSGRDLNEAEELRLRHYAESIIVKGARSPERLLNEVSLFLHLLQSELPADQQQMIRQSLEHEALFDQRKVLLVDDDIRNIFSLSSVLGEKGVSIVEASNGQEALQRLDEQPDLDLVLMDIMMPGMDGYETIRRIRQDPRFRRLPIIALTAKAMPGDQRLCLEAGASDYIPKPVDLDRLFSLMRVWLYQGAD